MAGVALLFSCKETTSEVIVDEVVEPDLKAGLNEIILDINGAERFFTAYVPESVTDETSLLFKFHGSRSVRAVPLTFLPIAEDALLHRIADRENLIVVYPVALLAENGSSYSWTHEEADLAFFDKMVDYFRQEFGQQAGDIHFKNVFVSGHSSGAIFSFKLAGNRADKIAAAVSVSGQYRLVAGVNDGFISDNISIPVRAYNGTLDQTVRYAAAWQNFKIWTERENKGDPDNYTQDSLLIGSYKINRFIWQDGLSDMEFYALDGVGHSISWDIIGESLWEFMKAHKK